MGINDCPADYPVEVLHQIWTGTTLGCDCGMKNINYFSKKKRADGQYLPNDYSEKKLSIKIGKNIFAVDKYCKKGKKGTETLC